MSYVPKSTVWDFKKKARLTVNKPFKMTITYRSSSTIVFELKGKKYCIGIPKALKDCSCNKCGEFMAHLVYWKDHKTTGTPIYTVLIDEILECEPCDKPKRKTYSADREISLREAIGDDAYDYGYIPDSQSRGWR